MELFDKDTLSNEDKRLDLKKKLTGEKIYMEMEDLEKLFEELGQKGSFFIETIKSYSDEDYKNVHPFLVSTLEENFKSEQFRKEILLQFGQNERSCVMSFPSGIRYTANVKKLPNNVPIIKIKAYNIVFILSYL